MVLIDLLGLYIRDWNLHPRKNRQDTGKIIRTTRKKYSVELEGEEKWETEETRKDTKEKPEQKQPRHLRNMLTKLGSKGKKVIVDWITNNREKYKEFNKTA